MSHVCTRTDECEVTGLLGLNHESRIWIWISAEIESSDYAAISRSETHGRTRKGRTNDVDPERRGNVFNQASKWACAKRGCTTSCIKIRPLWPSSVPRTATSDSTASAGGGGRGVILAKLRRTRPVLSSQTDGSAPVSLVLSPPRPSKLS